MARSREKDASVYDFLYVDQRRIGILLSQFGNDGVLTELTRLVGNNIETDVGLDVKIFKTGTKEGETETVGRKFDPQWLMPLLFLKASKDTITRDISNAAIGQIVIVKGFLSVLDLSILKFAWKSPIMRNSMLGSAASNLPTNASGAARRAHEVERKQAEHNITIGIEMVDSMPHTIQATLQSGSDIVWCGLREDSMIVTASDILMKYGENLVGEWAITGILDARPDPSFITGSGQPMSVSLLGNMARILAPVTRQVMGRPSDTYAMTPLIISRDVIGT